jgi:hypothetical protein
VKKNHLHLHTPMRMFFGKVKFINEIGFIKEIIHDASSVP